MVDALSINSFSPSQKRSTGLSLMATKPHLTMAWSNFELSRLHFENNTSGVTERDTEIVLKVEKFKLIPQEKSAAIA